MHEDTRKKLTTLWATQKVFGKLSILCDGRQVNAKRKQKPVGQQLTFPTSEEEQKRQEFLKTCPKVHVLFNDGFSGVRFGR